MGKNLFKQFTSVAKPTPEDMSPCPVYVTEHDGRRYFTAYVFGPIAALPGYYPLAEALSTMTSDDEMRIIIDSPGGYVSTGAQLASLIHHCEGKVITEARGLVASAAALMHSSAKKENQIAYDNSILMYHMSSGMSYGFSTDVLSSATAQVGYVVDCLLSKAVEDGHITQDELKRITSASDEIFISGKEFIRRTKGEEPEEAAPVEDVIGTESIHGTEAGNSIPVAYPLIMSTSDKNTLATRMGDDKGQNFPQPIVCYSENNHGGKTFRVYNAFSAPCRQHQVAVRRLCAFMDNLGDNDELIFMLGSDEEDGISSSMGSIIATATLHRDKIAAVALGPCSTAETMLWSQLTRRKVSRYGCLRFSCDKTLCSFRPVFKQYYIHNLEAAVQSNILSEDEANSVLETNQLISLHYFDCVKRNIAG